MSVLRSAGSSVSCLQNQGSRPLAESTIGLFKYELVNRRGPWKTFADLESAPAEWIDWYNYRRLHGAVGHVSPAEYETAYHHQHTLANEPVSA
jgi:putative transposase